MSLQLIPRSILLILIFVSFACALTKVETLALAKGNRRTSKALEALDDESNRPKSRRKRSLIFPTGSDVEFTIDFQIPLEALSATRTTFDVDIPFTYNLPNSTSGLYFGGRKMEDDHAAIFEGAEELLNKFGINGKSCILRLICELAESDGLPFNGLLGKALETVFLLDYGMSSTERLYEYISARTYGEHQGNCATAYPQCPFSVFSLLEHEDIMNDLMGQILP